MSSLSLKKDIKNKLKNIILGFLIFFIYPALMIFFILMHRKYISEVPMLGFHTNMEIFKRAGIYYFYLLVIHIPLFLVWKKLIFIITTLLGICAGLAYIFFCLYYQLYIFDNYDFLGKFYNIPSYKRPLNFIF